MKPMMLYEKAFWVMSFFLLGVLSVSFFPLGTSLLIPLLCGCFVVCALALFGRFGFALCALAMLFGSWYYALRAPTFPGDDFFNAKEFTGVIERVKLYPDYQILTVGTHRPNRFVIQATAQRYPLYAYGDEVILRGVLMKSKPDDSWFLKEGVVGMMRFAAVERGGVNQGGALRRTLFALRDRVADSFTRALPPEQATFMTGLTLGKSASFSETLREEMKVTGTTHLVALSGTNVTIITRGVMILFGFWFSRRALFPLTTAAIALFVIMTGAEASVVRAAIMAGIVLLAERTGRAHSTRNAIVAAAFLMVLANPSVLLFDIGFQLSFFALMGIVYLQPALGYIFGIERIPGKPLRAVVTIVAMTLAAQLAVFPISLRYFGFASIVSLVPNMLIALFISMTMFWGFIIFLASIFSSYLALLVALPARLLLGYELSIIHFFARFKIGITTESFPISLLVLYYVLLIGFILWAYKRKNEIIQ